MKIERFKLHLEKILGAAENASAFVDGMTFDSFTKDIKTQHAVGMSLIIIGDHASRAIDRCPSDVARHSDIPWQFMRGMRNQVAHGYADLYLPEVWNTATVDMRQLIVQVRRILESGIN